MKVYLVHVSYSGEPVRNLESVWTENADAVKHAKDVYRRRVAAGDHIGTHVTGVEVRDGRAEREIAERMDRAEPGATRCARERLAELERGSE